LRLDRRRGTRNDHGLWMCDQDRLSDLHAQMMQHRVLKASVAADIAITVNALHRSKTVTKLHRAVTSYQAG